MKPAKKISVFPFVQGLYYLFTLLWPLVDLDSFLMVTGHKEEIWLVVTVSFLLLPATVICFRYAFRQFRMRLLFILMMITALSLAGIELYYYLKGTIKWVYGADAALQLIFAAWWINQFARQENTNSYKKIQDEDI